MGTTRWTPGGLLLIGAAAWASDTAWETVVQERIQSNARAIQWLGGDPVAVMPAIAAVAHFRGDGVVLSDADGELLSLGCANCDDRRATLAVHGNADEAPASKMASWIAGALAGAAQGAAALASAARARARRAGDSPVSLPSAVPSALS